MFPVSERGPFDRLRIEPIGHARSAWELCHAVYVRSWPVTASGVFTEEQMRSRFAQVADLAFWEHHVGGSCRRFQGAVLVDGRWFR